MTSTHDPEETRAAQVIGLGWNAIKSWARNIVESHPWCAACASAEAVVSCTARQP